MSEPFIVFLIGIISALAGAYVGNLIARLRHTSESGKLEERIEQLREQEDKLKKKVDELPSFCLLGGLLEKPFLNMF